MCSILLQLVTPPKNLGSSSEAHYGIFALQKTDMEPENDGFQKGRKLLFHMSIFWSSILVFTGCACIFFGWALNSRFSMNIAWPLGCRMGNAIVTTKMTWFPKPKPSLFNSFPTISSWFQGFPKNFSIRNIYKFLTFHGDLGPKITWALLGVLWFSPLFSTISNTNFKWEELRFLVRSKSWHGLAWGFSPRENRPPKIMGNPEFLQ